MAVTAIDLKQITDDQLEKDLKDLKAKTEATPEEKEKLSTLKEERQSRYERKIDKLHSEKLAEKNRAEKLERELEEKKSKLAEVEKEKHVASRPKIVDDTIEFGGKKFYTDEALQSMVAAEELTPQQAYAHQRARDKAEIIKEIEEKESAKSKANESKRVFDEDKEKVLKDYPHFNASHADHDPEDPLYKTTSELWLEGLQSNPRGLSIAIKRAKQILRMSDERPDVSNEHSVGRNRTSSEIGNGGEVEVKLNAQEEEAALRMYGNIINPITQRNYTDKESIIKATNAKKARMKR